MRSVAHHRPHAISDGIGGPVSTSLMNPRLIRTSGGNDAESKLDRVADHSRGGAHRGTHRGHLCPSGHLDRPLVLGVMPATFASAVLFDERAGTTGSQRCAALVGIVALFAGGLMTPPCPLAVLTARRLPTDWRSPHGRTGRPASGGRPVLPVAPLSTDELSGESREHARRRTRPPRWSSARYCR